MSDKIGNLKFIDVQDVERAPGVSDDPSLLMADIDSAKNALAVTDKRLAKKEPGITELRNIIRIYSISEETYQELVKVLAECKTELRSLRKKQDILTPDTDASNYEKLKSIYEFLTKQKIHEVQVRKQDKVVVSIRRSYTTTDINIGISIEGLTIPFSFLIKTDTSVSAYFEETTSAAPPYLQTYILGITEVFVASFKAHEANGSTPLLPSN